MHRNRRREGFDPSSPFGAQHQPPRSVSAAAAYAAGDDGTLAKRTLGSRRSAEVKSSAKVIQDPDNGRNHVVWVVSDGDLEQKQQIRNSKAFRRRILSLKQILRRNKRPPDTCAAAAALTTATATATATATDGAGCYPATPSPAHSLNTEASDQLHLTAAEEDDSDRDTPKPSESLEDGHGAVVSLRTPTSPGRGAVDAAPARPGSPSAAAAAAAAVERSYPVTVAPSPFSPVALGLLQTHSPDGQSLLSLICTNEELLRQLVFKTNAIDCLEARAAEMTNIVDELKEKVDEGEARETEQQSEIEQLHQYLAEQDRIQKAQIEKQTLETQRLHQLQEQLTTENEALKTQLEAITSQVHFQTKNNLDLEKLIMELGTSVATLTDEVNYVKAERDAFKKSYLKAKLEVSEKSEEYRDKIISLINKHREMLSTIRTGSRFGPLTQKKLLLKTEKLLDLKSEKQFLKQKVDFLSGRSLVQDIHVSDLRQVVSELVLTLVDNKVEPTYALTQSLQRVNMPIEDLVQERRSAADYSWATLETTTTSSEDAAQTEDDDDDDDDEATTSDEQGQEEQEQEEDTEKEEEEEERPVAAAAAAATTNRRPQRRTKRRSRTRATPQQNSDVTESD